MYRYYAAPVRRNGRTLSADPLGGDCVLSTSPHNAWVELGSPGPRELLAVWGLGRPDVDERYPISLEEAGRICSAVPATKIYVSFSDGALFPLDLNPLFDLHVGTRNAGAN
jgi:hypothetical protein